MDYYAWTREQARLLREAAERADTPLDFEHLAEEVESMGRSEVRALEGALTRVLEHLLTLEFSPTADPRNGWKASVVEHGARARRDLKASPSLRGRIELDELYRDARTLALLGLERDGIVEDDMPADCPYDLDSLLDAGCWPASRHGLA